jgi:D-beta-D-heptose 7-phosphate kinase/D-beta-D-heptose 1-phosphate adenosyltransferase
VTRALERNREEGRSVVFTNGVFDLLHAGHIELLRRARDLGDLLVVGINSDQSVRRLKGRSRPINHEQDRLAVISALSFVDHAFLFDPDTAIDAIQALRPDIYVKGGDYRVETLPEAPAMREIGGRIVILPHLGGLSTSGLIDRILSLSAPGRLVPLPDSAANAWA